MVANTPYPRARPCPSSPESIRIELDPDTDFQLTPGDTVRVTAYGNRLYQYEKWTASRRAVFTAVGVGSPVPLFSISTDQLLTDFSDGKIALADCTWWTIIADTITCLRDRDWIDLSPPAKGDVPEWMQTTRQHNEDDHTPPDTN